MNKALSKKVCFIVGPIGSAGTEIRTHSDWLYEGIIKPATKEFPDFGEPVRADKISQPGMITTQIIEFLLDADLVIADLSFLNPNAFYEIGIRHMVQKPIIHMQLDNEKEPFDVSGYRAIRFSLKHPADLVSAQRELIAAMKLASSSDHKVENPVTHARGRLEFERSATPVDRVVLEELRSLSSRVDRIEAIGGVKRAKRTIAFWDIDVTCDGIRPLKQILSELSEIVGNYNVKITTTGNTLGVDFKGPKPPREKIEEIADKLVLITGVTEVEI